jgi:hypothetical protein
LLHPSQESSRREGAAPEATGPARVRAVKAGPYVVVF